MSPVINTTVRKTTIKVEPNLEKKGLQHGNNPSFGLDYSDVIVISSDSEPESKPRVKKEEDVGIRIRLKEPVHQEKGMLLLTPFCYFLFFFFPFLAFESCERQSKSW